MSRRFAPWRGVDSSPGQELLGVITSHGPSRESYRSAQKASGWATEAIARAGRGSGVVCSKGASNAFIPGRRASAIAARTAGRRRGSGRVGRPSNDTGRRLPARRNATSKAGVTGSARKPGKHQIQRQLSEAARVITPEHFFRARLRPAGVLRGIRASSGEVPCSAFVRTACRRALERVEERERRWKQARDLIRRY